MRPFKFFQKEVKGTLDLYEGETRATASLNDGQRFIQEVINYHHPRTYINADTPEGYMGRRRLYHTDRELYDRFHNATDEIERFTLERALIRRDIVTEDNNRTQILNGTITQEQYNLNRDMLAESERLRNQIRLFQATRVTTVNPKWWTRVKMFFQKLSLYSDQALPITVIATIITFVVILILSKILNVW
jgi:hypothetical protein